MAPLVAASLIGAGSAAVGGGMSLFGGRRQQAAANAQAAAQMQFERENMLYQNQVAIEMMHDQQLASATEAAVAREWNKGEAGVARDWQSEQSGIERTFNATEAAKNRAWQEEMSGSAYQRAVKDMSSAGINPMLAYMKGGADTGGGATASTRAPSTSAAQGAQASMGGGSPSGLARGAQAQQTNYIGNAVASAANIAQTIATFRNMAAQNEKIEADTENVKADIRVKDEIYKQGRTTVDPETGRVVVEGPGARVRAEGRKAFSESERAETESAKAKSDAVRAENEAKASKEGPAKALAERRAVELENERRQSNAELERFLRQFMQGGGASASMIERFGRMVLPALIKMLMK